MTERLFSTSEAAEYLGVKVVTGKKHIHVLCDLKPDQKIGGVLVFRQSTLDEFQARRRPRGRPKTKTLDTEEQAS